MKINRLANLLRYSRLLALAGVSVLCAAAAPGAVPDISGPWMIYRPHGALKTTDGEPPPLLPAAAATYAANRAELGTPKDNDPDLRCLPPGVPRLFLQRFPFNIVQGKTMYAMMFEWNHLPRVIYLVPSHSETIGPLYLGQSIGHWEGDTLVVDANSYNDTTWLDDTGLPHSEDLHTVERIRLTDGDSELADTITIDDPTDYTRSWTTMLLFKKDPGVIIKEDYCLGRVGKAKLTVK